MHDFWLNGDFSSRKGVIFGLNGIVTKRICVIFGLNEGYLRENARV